MYLGSWTCGCGLTLCQAHVAFFSLVQPRAASFSLIHSIKNSVPKSKGQIGIRHAQHSVASVRYT
jgi:hypothetical protein